jgi:hypothetical protein
VENLRMQAEDMQMKKENGDSSLLLMKKARSNLTTLPRRIAVGVGAAVREVEVEAAVAAAAVEMEVEVEVEAGGISLTNELSQFAGLRGGCCSHQLFLYSHHSRFKATVKREKDMTELDIP